MDDGVRLINLVEIKVAYIAGPMSKLTPEELGLKAREAAQLEAYLVRSGWKVYNPYGSCFHEDCWAIDPEDWYDHDEFWVQFCHAIVLLPGWEDSEGVKRELACAERFDLYVYEWREGKLVAWTDVAQA